MPSHADRVRRHCTDADPQADPPATGTREALRRPFSDLERYAGWLARDHVSAVVRADVHALGAALHEGHDTSVLLLTLDRNIGRLPGGDIRKMLRTTLGKIRTALGPGGLDARDGENS